MIVTLITAALAALIFCYCYLMKYWNRVGVPQGPLKFQIIEFIRLFFPNRNFAESSEIYYQMFQRSRYFGFYQFTSPVLIIKDPELIKEITIKSFDHFNDHPAMVPENVEPLWSKNLFALKGQKWRDMRSILSPAFTSSKMRSIFMLITDSAQNFVQYFSKKDEDIIEVEFRDCFSRFTNDVIATTAFGIKTDSLENQQNQFYLMGNKLRDFSSGILNLLKFLIIAVCPKISQLLKISVFKKDVMSFFKEIIDDTLEIRKEKGIVRPDMIHLLLEAQKGIEKEEQIQETSFAEPNEFDLGKQIFHQKELTNIDIAAQALIFFFAGFDSVATAMSFTAYELAVNPYIQKRLRKEIIETSKNSQENVTYEAILKMKYMDMVVSESLRKWPPASIIDRECSNDYTIQPKLPGEISVYLKAKTTIWIPIYAIHRDPNIYPDPKKFDPERFNKENKSNIPLYSYLPFGLGPRNCIGSRFALLEIKTILFYLLKRFELVPTQKSEIPLKLTRGSFTLTAENGLWFGLKKLKDF